jgi:hypothetical protein
MLEEHAAAFEVFRLRAADHFYAYFVSAELFEPHQVLGGQCLQESFDHRTARWWAAGRVWRLRRATATAM